MICEDIQATIMRQILLFNSPVGFSFQSRHQHSSKRRITYACWVAVLGQLRAGKRAYALQLITQYILERLVYGTDYVRNDEIIVWEKQTDGDRPNSAGGAGVLPSDAQL
jgi:hypothetical protein